MWRTSKDKVKYKTLIGGGASEMIELVDVDSKEQKAPGS